MLVCAVKGKRVALLWNRYVSDQAGCHGVEMDKCSGGAWEDEGSVEDQEVPLDSVVDKVILDACLSPKIRPWVRNRYPETRCQ